MFSEIVLLCDTTISVTLTVSAVACYEWVTSADHAFFHSLWRVTTGLHQQIMLSFMLSGHTKFSPDWSFGLLKQWFRREMVSCLEDLAATVDASAQHNIVELAGQEDGTVFVNMYDWTAYLRIHF